MGSKTKSRLRKKVIMLNLYGWHPLELETGSMRQLRIRHYSSNRPDHTEYQNPMRPCQPRSRNAVSEIKQNRGSQDENRH